MTITKIKMKTEKLILIKTIIGLFQLYSKTIQ